MLSRREFLLAAAAVPAARAGSALTPKERVDRIVKGADPDRLAFTFWYHFRLEKPTPERFAFATLEFHRKFRTDLVKVMNNLSYTPPPGKWYTIRPQKSPLPEHLRTLEMVRDGLGGKAHFIETVWNPWMIAESLAGSREELLQMKNEKPQYLLNALEAIARSQANHARLALGQGASGIFLAVNSAQATILSRDEYVKFSEPFDRMILEAVNSAPLNTVHVHGDKIYLHKFYQGWPINMLSYSAHASGVAISTVRSRFGGVMLGGIDERKFRTIDSKELKRQIHAAKEAAGTRLIVAPGCTLSSQTPDEDMLRLPRLIGA
ncbi:MAG: uroporphyrinogen decarboxylase family protein [Bryobacteraceae bacterium]